MVSTAARDLLSHKIGLYVALLVTLITDAMAIAYVVETRKKCHVQRQVRRSSPAKRNQADLGWTLVGLAAADILLATIICGLLEYTRFL